MSFQRLQIRYQTARSLPAPYAHFYTLTLQPIGNGTLQTDLAITYPDRDDIDDDELIAEGFSREDDLTWSGNLPKAWADTLAALVRDTRLQPFNEDALGEDDDYWAMVLEISNGTKKEGTPPNANDWQYTIQELIQAVYERLNRERPFELTYLDNRGGGVSIERRLMASFAERTLTLMSNQGQRDQKRPLPWATLQSIMSKVYENDYNPEEAQLKRPARSGQWLNLGGEEWFDVTTSKSLTRWLSEL
jgi:hypothetical protein